MDLFLTMEDIMGILESAEQGNWSYKDIRESIQNINDFRFELMIDEIERQRETDENQNQ